MSKEMAYFNIENGDSYEIVDAQSRSNIVNKIPYPRSNGTRSYGTEGQVLMSNGTDTPVWTSIDSYTNGILWDVQDVYLLRQVLSHIKYDSASAGTIAEQLLTSLESKPEDQGWSRTQITLLDTLLSHVKYTDNDGGEYADMLIASLKGQPVTVEYTDGNEVEY